MFCIVTAKVPLGVGPLPASTLNSQPSTYPMPLYTFLAGAWTAVLWFFTLGVARHLFGVFPRERAGEVTTALFPAYFSVAIALGLLATIVLWLRRRDRRDSAALALGEGLLQAGAADGVAYLQSLPR